MTTASAMRYAPSMSAASLPSHLQARSAADIEELMVRGVCLCFMSSDHRQTCPVVKLLQGSSSGLDHDLAISHVCWGLESVASIR